MNYRYFIDAKAPSGATALYDFANSEAETIDIVEGLIATRHTVKVYKCERMYVRHETRVVAELVPLKDGGDA